MYDKIEYNKIDRFINKCFSLAIPFYICRLPSTRNIIMGANLDGCFSVQDDIKTVDNGFVVAKFNGQGEFYHINPDFTIEDLSNINEIDSILKKRCCYKEEAKEESSDINKDTYVKNIQYVIDYIAQGKLDKVIISRTKTIELDETKTIFSLFNSLEMEYKQAFVFAFYIPGNNIWLGASPELFFAKNDNNFRTMALAGTSKFADTWKDKEYREHTYVSNYIENILYTYKTEFTKSDIHSRRAGNIYHLCTEFSGLLGDKNDIQEMINSLHPTPALGGYPKKKALEFINKIESHNREFYGGYIGLVEKNNIDLYVNLRSMEILNNNNIKLYIGGGITIDSNPENEWEETNDKAKTILNII